MISIPARLLDRFAAESVSAIPTDGRLRVTFLGVTTILLDDGKTRIMTDGFFSRPGLLKILRGKIAPDEERVAFALSGGRALGGTNKKPLVNELDAVMTLHSHYDHAMDTANVAMRTGATVFGSESTVQIARGGGVPEDRICEVRDGDKFKLGEFVVTVIAAEHSPGIFFRYHGHIKHPLLPPSPMSAYREGGSYAYLIEHRSRRILILGSAGYRKDMLRGVKADVVFLPVGKLGNQDKKFMQEYWQETVTETDPHQVFLTHWDNFFLPLDRPLEPFLLIDDFEAAMEFLVPQAKATGVDLFVPKAFQTVALSELRSNANVTDASNLTLHRCSALN